MFYVYITHDLLHKEFIHCSERQNGMRTENTGVSGHGKWYSLVRRLSHERKWWGQILEPSAKLDYGKFQMPAQGGKTLFNKYLISIRDFCHQNKDTM